MTPPDDHTLDHTPQSGADTPLAGPEPTDTFDPARTTARGPDAPPADAPEFPGFAVLGEIARGGMGCVYSARDLTLGREVAVKTLLPGADPDRFEAEARVTARLPHPNIPPVHHLGTGSDGLPFLAMKLVRGRTLAGCLGGRPASAADLPGFVQVFEQVCQAVGFAHAQGIIHRDLKPANVMVGAFGEVQVMDWGLAKEMSAPEAEDGTGTAEGRSAVTRGSATETTFGQALGTPAYMPPEQARGEWDRVGARADVFALGGVLADILTGHPVYQGRSALEVLRRATAGDVGAAHDRLGGCGADAELIAVAQRCLAADPLDRFANGEEVAGAVAAYRAGVEARLRAAERDRAVSAAEAREQRKRRRVQLALVSAVLLFVVAGGAVAWWQDRQASERKAQAAHDDAERKAVEARLEGDKRLAEEREANAAREQRARNGGAVGLLVGRCEAALRDRDDEGGAADALAEIDRLLPGGGAEPLGERIAQCRTDLAVLKQLNRVDTDWWTVADGKPLHTGAENAAAVARAFADFGIVPGRTPDAYAARQVGASLVRERLVGALDLWLVFEPLPEVRRLLAAADAHPFRDAIRDAFVAKDGNRVRKLADSEEVVDQPPRFAIALCTSPTLSMSLREDLLQKLVRQRPDHHPLLMTLAGVYPVGAPETAADRLRWYQAAAALRPKDVAVFNNLGVALKDQGDTDGAIEYYRAAIKLDPEYAPVHNNLGVALADKKDIDAAIPCFRTATKLDPSCAFSHYNLSLALKLKGDAPGCSPRSARP